MSAWLQGNFSTVMKGNYEWLFLMIPLWFVIYLFAYHFTVVGMGEAFANSLGVHYREFSFRFDAVALASAIVLLMVGNIPF